MWDAIFTNAKLATMCAGRYAAIAPGAVAAEGGRIAWVGPTAELPGEPGQLAREVHDLRGRWVTPGLVDCHTHLVHAGDRAREFELRLQGATYEEIARAGGGIVSTVAATRDASETALGAATQRLNAASRCHGDAIAWRARPACRCSGRKANRVIRRTSGSRRFRSPPRAT